jgi:hypothetical protein
VRDNRPGAAVYFVTFQMIGTFLVLNLFVSMIIENFNRHRDETERVNVLTESQRVWLDIRPTLSSLLSCLWHYLLSP